MRGENGAFLERFLDIVDILNEFEYNIEESKRFRVATR